MQNIPAVPVVVLQDADLAVPLARTLLSAGIGAMEITLRSSAALAAIEKVAAEVPEILLGAGSVRRAEQFQEIADAGAGFAVSPGCTDQLLAAAKASGISFVPGVATASEVLELLEKGITLQKFFPAELAGGCSMLKSWSAPIPEARFFPTGGITAARAKDYLCLDNVCCVGGSWFVPEAALAERDFAKILQLAGDAARIRTSMEPADAGL